MRVIAGTARGRRLSAPRGHRTRPTSDKVREALFAILSSMSGPLEGGAVLDVFAGTGALGIEAMSRGADCAIFIDSNREAAAVLTGNLETTGFADRSRVITRDFNAAFSFLEQDGMRFRLVFLDPPYRKGLLQKCLDRLQESTLLERDCVVVAELSSREHLDTAFGALELMDRRVYGDTALAFFTMTRKGQQ
ncbi:MAG: Ribosomal RNA small subunit methyltransferase D [Syntrophus sp. PtaB.Bin138]|nr:MAG: Ribosomal RNA small subunit methyltransferase D [Syntrophus sp. PtaB.Bin138]